MVISGAETLVRGGAREEEALQLEREAQMQLDPYGELLQPPKEPSKEYATFDGGVDLARMGFAPTGQTRKVVKRKEGVETASQQEGSADSASAVMEVIC